MKYSNIQFCIHINIKLNVKSVKLFENLLDGVVVWVVGGGLFSGIWPAAVIWWVSGSVIVNLTKGDRFLAVSPFVVPKNIIFLFILYF